MKNNIKCIKILIALFLTALTAQSFAQIKLVNDKQKVRYSIDTLKITKQKSTIKHDSVLNEHTNSPQKKKFADATSITPSYPWQVGISVFCNVLASIIFIFLLLLFGKPSFKISCYMCVNIESDPDYNPDNKPEILEYGFKIVNRSRFEIFDADVELIFSESKNLTAPGNDALEESLKIRTASMKHINRYRKWYKKKDPQALFANLVVTNVNLQERLNKPDSKLILTVVAKHGLTGLSGITTQTFTKDKLKINHRFGFAKDINVYPVKS